MSTLAMSSHRKVNHSKLTAEASNAIPNYDWISKHVKIPKIDGLEDFERLKFLHDPKFAIMQKTMPMPEKRLLYIPHKRMNNWNNYIVHSLHPDYSDSWREYCKVPDNWIGPEHKKND